ncbi:YcaO-like family protein [Halohasta litorea]|uniref:YcaO-like family protein n=1 Tax=Halohasta litorea TaxID=869891 RepID=A0ABD6D214_9EURY|nr:YcaO-like family protein [Halohasta litorea]
MAEVDEIIVTDAETADHSSPDDKRDVLARLQSIADPETGIITGVRRVPVPPGEPAIESYVVDREDFAPLTDGEAMAHNEGGCGFDREGALVATYGEAIERYCGCVYRADAFRTASYADLAEPALDPTAVVNFSSRQRAAMGGLDSLCGVNDELSWIAGENLATEANTAIPAQLVYLSYPTSAEPFIRNPISTGLAAGSSRAMAIRNAVCEIVERDAFMIWYLTETELPVIDPETAPPRIRRLVDRVTAHGLELTLLDATTDLGVPVAIAVVVDREHRPAVTVAAASGPEATAVLESALEEVIQTRLWGVRQLDLEHSAEIPHDEITSYTERGLFWSPHDRIADLDFWIDSSRETTVDAFAADELSSNEVVDRITAAGYDCYGVDVTTRDIAGLGFTVQRVIAPRLQPLYLLERLRYLGGDRLFEVPVEMGYRETQPTEAALNTVPHPFP